MSARFDVEKLQALIGEGWLRVQRHPEADLWIYNYTQQCQYRRQWTHETLACRGLILDADGNVVARPFAKFFNLGEPCAPKLPVDEPFNVTEKMDGSLAIYYELDGDPQIASRGSFTSEQAFRGKELLCQRSLEAVPGTTPVFELLAPWNRIVVDYGDTEDLFLLDCIDQETGLSTTLPPWSGFVVPTHHVEDPRDLHGMYRPNAEGFVVSWQQGAKRVKIKFEDYVRLHRIVSGLSEHRVWEALRAGDDLRVLAGIPDEAYSFIEEVSKRILREVKKLREDAERVYESVVPIKPRSEIAKAYFASDANPNLCFSLLDGKDIEKQLWKIVEPKADAPA